MTSQFDTPTGFSDRLRLPRHARDMRIGLLGGSFNPPHEGHRLISLQALRRLQLDRIWWLVTPGNPLKDVSRLPPSAERAHAAVKMAADPRIDVTTIEDAIGTRYTAETLSWLTRRCPQVRFVWMMGADNLAGFHHWRQWRHIAELMPIAVFDRPGATLAASGARAAIALRPYRVRESEASCLAGYRTPAWIFFHGKRSPLSSTSLRTQCQADMTSS